MMRIRRHCLLPLLFTLTLTTGPALAADAPPVVTLDSAAPLLEIKVMVKAGSAADPAELEGLAYLTAESLIEGGFGDLRQPVTKEKLAEITQPWGSGPYPVFSISKETPTC